MRKFLALCSAVLFFSVAVAAQDISTTPATSPATTTASPARYAPSEFNRWQIGVNYNYIRFRPSPGASFNLHGFNTSVSWYKNEWLALEGDVGAAFGSTPSSGGPGGLTPGGLDAKLVLYGGGPHLAYRQSQKISPWVHALFGGAHFRFDQTGAPSANLAKLNAFAYMLGGGVDIKLGSKISWRIQGDFLGTRFFSTWQKNAQAQTGIVLNF